MWYAPGLNTWASLFILNMNGMCNVSDIFFTIMYADDTSLLVNGNDLHSLIASLNNALKDLCSWFKSNKLSLNTNKTFCMIFHRSRIKCDTDSTIDIIMDNSILRKNKLLKISRCNCRPETKLDKTY